ncbi:Ku domain protein [Bacillus sp. JCM 19045]|nr:Ku domain protein [Bacillus sp. JCM 19045]
MLREGLLKAGKIGVAKIIIRSKEQLAIVRVYQTGLMMETIHFPDEVRKFEDVPNIPEGQEIVKKELDAALMLIDQLTTPFDPDKYQDEYRHALMDLIEKKKSGEEIVTASEKPKEASNVTDIMSALQASIDQTKKKKAPAKKKATTKTKKNA